VVLKLHIGRSLILVVLKLIQGGYDFKFKVKLEIHISNSNSGAVDEDEEIIK